MNMKHIAALHLEGIKKAASELAKLKGWNLKSLGGALRCAPMVIKEVETIGRLRQLPSKEKQQLAVELFLQLVPLPWFLPESVVRPLLEAFVDAVVAALKDRF